MFRIRRKINQARYTISQVHDIANTINNIIDISQNAEETVPQPKSISGATNLFLPKIKNDFPDFHNPDAESDICSVLSKHLQIIHSNGDIKYDENTVNEILNKNIIKKELGTISDIKYHKISIYNYTKTLDFATIYYKCAVGYRLNNKPIETRYEIQYTLQLQESGVATQNVRCKHCGAPLENFTSSIKEGFCPYCSTKFIRDTILSWKITSIKELN